MINEASIWDNQNEEEKAMMDKFMKKMDGAIKEYMAETGASRAEASEKAVQLLASFRGKKMVNGFKKTLQNYFPY